MGSEQDRNDESLTSLVVILPLAVIGFAAAAGSWTLFAVAGIYLRASLGLTEFEFSLLLVAPMAAGALVAVPAGLAANSLGARKVMIGCLAGVALSMGVLLVTESFPSYLLASVGLGLTAGMYSAGLQFISRYGPANHVGLICGTFGAGIIGAGLSYYLVPLLITAFSWRAVPLAYLIILLLALVLLVLLTDDQDGLRDRIPEQSWRQFLAPSHYRRSGEISLWFGAVAGSFLALALWLPDLLTSQFLLTATGGARLALWFVVPGALGQILGGGLADRLGSNRVIRQNLALGLMVLAVLSYPTMTLLIQGIDGVIRFDIAFPLALETALVVLLGGALGSAMGALLQRMAVERPTCTALNAGMMLLSACLIAFVLPVTFYAANLWLGVRSVAFMMIFLLLATCLMLFSRSVRRQERLALLQSGV
ncbi:MFS transporter [Marinobacter changyiensis]|uniref:MFS transporter n=1 Tax=Marinobacter changyiensis TaxID=2604091 RepID=UPI00126452B8|nr:MFS transporter [Marinobacter changyiensis]